MSVALGGSKVRWREGECGISGSGSKADTGVRQLSDGERVSVALVGVAARSDGERVSVALCRI